MKVCWPGFLPSCRKEAVCIALCGDLWDTTFTGDMKGIIFALKVHVLSSLKYFYPSETCKDIYIYKCSQLCHAAAQGVCKHKVQDV